MYSVGSRRDTLRRGLTKFSIKEVLKGQSEVKVGSARIDEFYSKFLS